MSPLHPLLPGRKVLTCCIPGCAINEVVDDDTTRVICWFHCTTHTFPRDTQTTLDLPPATEEVAA